ncbi:Polyketide cyclase / dehydrase and lipid transport [Goodfellowiella coeruleoviolacea]|uniref:Polyketide cyclase / dehydrase and lipid transport n=1 Tax=Goodfellowiella coeruleoviolacea TaxID=334858 RepID=A0AAE3KEB8_9PSEU|nr:Polyketide cyclase / dehydrase and lipid transport [Goodfellowiella coeruleoviolacea]
MTTIQKSIDVHEPVRTVYNQWTQFETFPQFMEGVDRITQISDTRTHWKTSIGGVTREFDAEITEQHPDERVAWHTVEGPSQRGVVTFHRLDNENSRVTLQMEYEPETLTEKAGAALGVVEHRVAGDLRRFKEFIEHRGQATGAWRGEVPRPGQAGEQPSTGEPRADRGGVTGQSVPPTGEGGPGQHRGPAAGQAGSAV